MEKGAADFVERLDRQAVADAIREEEAKGLGEIRVHIQRGNVADALVAARETFLRLGMNRTDHRSGCLIFVAPDVRAFAVVGDEKLDRKVDEGFWERARDAAGAHFGEGRFTEGIVAAVRIVGAALAAHFPRGDAENPNELPDEVSEDEPQAN